MQQERAERLWRTAMQVNRSFLRLRPIYPMARQLALNAEVASARLGRDGRALNIVMREVGGVTHVLSALVSEVETTFADLVRQVAIWISLDARLRGYMQAIDHARSRSGQPALAWLEPLSAQSLAQWQQEAQQAPPAEAALWRALLTHRRDLVAIVTEVQYAVQVLDRLAERVGWVANRQTKYLATVACVETQRIGDASVSTLSERLRVLAEDIGGVESDARAQIDRLLVLGRALNTHLHSGAA